MKALVKVRKGIGNLEIRDMPIPVPGPEDILINVAYCGLCGTDIHIHNDEFPNDPPVIIGHEFSGVVSEAGRSVKGFAKGDRVVSELHTGACRTCRLCRAGCPHICPSKRPVGSRENGAMAEYIKLPAWLAHKLPEGVSLKNSALCEPFAILCHALITRARVEKPDSLLILGSSTVGIIATVVASNIGISNICVAGTNMDENFRLPLAKELGACVTVNVQRQEIKQALKEFTDSEGPDVIVECSGSPAAITSAIRLIRRRGKLVLIGLAPGQEISVPWNDILYKEIDIVSSFSSTASDWERVIKMLPGIKSGMDKIITHTIPLEDWQRGFELMKTGQAVKVMVEINKQAL